MRKAAYQPGPKAIGARIGKLTRPALKKRGFAAADILLHWDRIVGRQLAQYSCPEKLGFARQSNRDAVLKLRVAPGHAPEIMHLEPQIVEKINAFFGYRAVARLQLIQAPIERKQARAEKKLVPLSEDAARRLDAILRPVQDQNLKNKLQSLGERILAKK